MYDDIYAAVPRRTAGKNPTGGALEGIAAELAQAKAEKEEEERMLEKHRQLHEQKQQQQLANRRQTLQVSQLLLAGFVFWLAYTHVIGIYLFTRGFLLTRFVLDSHSDCNVSPLGVGVETEGFKADAEKGCWHPRSFNKAVVVIIDALRYDFTVPYEQQPEMPYHNAFKALYEIASSQPEHAILLPFIADPPTATLQRLKGLTTGTLPTFIDAGSNFAGDRIEEDNLIAQLRRAGRKIAFMGDDTWVSLFPGSFDIEHPYESLNVWDLHTVDEGVLEHIFPLLHPSNSTKWDVLIGHFLGVDHAGHRYGPDHPQMKAKLKQMDGFVRQLVDSVDDETLVVIMGDHGMDPKGDHGGESQLELEAALWMYSKKPHFGRADANKLPPKGAWEKFVAQIDLVPTLALLLGLPIPYNNLGSPIEEAFIKPKGNDWENMATVSRLTGAQIRRYQKEYASASKSDMEGGAASLDSRWQVAEEQWQGLRTSSTKLSSEQLKGVYEEFVRFQKDTLNLCKDLWARFDLPSMAAGVVVLLSSIGVAIVFSRGIAEQDVEEITGITLLRCISAGITGALAFWRASHFLPMVEMSPTNLALLGSAMGGNAGFFYSAVRLRSHCTSILPNSLFGWLAVLFTVSQGAMFAANSFTIWEDRILTYFLTTFAIVAIVASQRQSEFAERALGTYHSIVFLVLTRIASMSRLCREEQMPYCESTYYASATSSVSSPWSLAIIFVIAVVFPSIIRSFYVQSKSFEGETAIFINVLLRGGLFLVATYWTLDSADNGEWFSLPQNLLKMIKMTVAQVALSLGFVAGVVFFAWSKMYLSVEPGNGSGGESLTVMGGMEENGHDKSKKSSPSSATPKGGSQKSSKPSDPATPPTKSMFLTGYANLYGSRYFLLVISSYLGFCLLQKPLGSASLGIMTYQLLSLLEILDINSLSDSAIGPVVCALLGASHYFSTGHQASPSSVQWESAFIPIDSIKYPWSPMLVAGNTLGPQILAAIAVPATALWKQSPKKPGLLGRVTRATATHIAYHLVIATATVMWAGHLRRHLMLYRVFSPRFMLGALVLMVTNVAAICALCGVIWMITIGSSTVKIIIN